MFRQIEVDPRHRCWQQILWRESPNDSLCAYQLKTVTYGMACSLYNAERVLNQCANDNQYVVSDAGRAATARDSILRNFYMDDLLDSADTPAEAITLARDINTILQQGQFRLCKLKSNNMGVISATSDSDISSATLGLGDSSMSPIEWPISKRTLISRIGII